MPDMSQGQYPTNPHQTRRRIRTPPLEREQPPLARRIKQQKVAGSTVAQQTIKTTATAEIERTDERPRQKCGGVRVGK